MTPMDAAWNLLKANPQHELVQNRYRFTGQGHPFLDEKGNPTNNTKRDLVEQMRLATLHPSIHPAKRFLVDSVSGRPTNIKQGPSLHPVEPTDILRYPVETTLQPHGFNLTGSETGRGDLERMREQREQEDQRLFLVGHTGRLRDHAKRGLPTLSEDEMENLRQQAQQMPFSYYDTMLEGQ